MFKLCFPRRSITITVTVTRPFLGNNLQRFNSITITITWPFTFTIMFKLCFPRRSITITVTRPFLGNNLQRFNSVPVSVILSGNNLQRYCPTWPSRRAVFLLLLLLFNSISVPVSVSVSVFSVFSVFKTKVRPKTRPKTKQNRRHFFPSLWSHFFDDFWRLDGVLSLKSCCRWWTTYLKTLGHAPLWSNSIDFTFFLIF